MSWTRKTTIVVVVVAVIAALTAVSAVLLFDTGVHLASVGDDPSWSRFSPPSELPIDFAVEYSRGPCHVEWGDAEYVTISQGSRAYELAVGTRRPVWSEEAQNYTDRVTEIRRAEVARQDCQRLYTAVVDNGFFEMDRRYWDPDIVDGTVQTLAVTAEGRTKTVSVGNAAVRAFDRIVSVLRELAAERQP